MAEQKGSEPEDITVPEVKSDKGSLDVSVDAQKVGQGLEPDSISGESNPLFDKSGQMTGTKPPM